ncbi:MULTISPECIES: RNA polymerase sigma factor [Corynebacterium]|uniref:RNA polymerase sigma factor n=1 Tax=Corynebacterium TaxID=1716 RepID=UPI000832075B|nr:MULTISPECIES: sigma-70 family RNA polymerase sigma factor [Corynebacterium]MBF9011468.1 sigma-70 family RNA polymerase sigma factor [Corynebacterium phoceense]
MSHQESTPELSDDQLIEAFLEGDDKAFGHIFHRHRQRLTYVARKYTHNDTDAQDIVQEAFLKASTALERYRGDAQLGTWLHRLVMNVGFDFLNHRANRENPSLDTGGFDPDRNPALAYEHALDTQLMVREALARLGEAQRVALYLTEIEGLSLADAAAAQGVRTGTIKSRRARAKETLRSVMAD